MSKIGGGLILTGFLGIFTIGLLLLTNHWGVAIKVGNYTYFLFTAGSLYEISYK